MKIKELFFGGLLLIIAGTLAYYVFVYLPHKDNIQQQQVALANKTKEAANDLTMQQKCRDAGEKAYKQEEDADNVPGLQLVSDPQYYYSKELNKCLYSYEITEKLDVNEPQDNGIPWRRYVKDSLTNQEIIGYIHNVYDKSPQSQKAMMDFSSKEDKIMGDSN